MSMLTAQCGKLRKRAAELRQGRWSDGADDARLMEEAADIIENLRLRLTDITVHDERVDRLEEENAELRELVRDMYGCGDSCTHCKHWNQGDGFYCDLGVGWKARRVREMGIEVD